MGVKMVFPRFSLGEVILYQNKMYYINSIYNCNEGSFTYGLALITSNLKEPYANKELLVHEGLLKNITHTERLIWKVLYGENL